MVKPRLQYEVLKWADKNKLQAWDVRVFGTDQEGGPFETILKFEVPVDMSVVAENLAMFSEGMLRQLPN